MSKPQHISDELRLLCVFQLKRGVCRYLRKDRNGEQIPNVNPKYTLIFCKIIVEHNMQWHVQGIQSIVTPHPSYVYII